MDDFTIQALSENDPQLGDFFLYVDDDTFPESDTDGNADRLIQALENNTQVVSIDADMHVFALTEPLQRVMSALGRLSRLTSIRCTSSGSYEVTIQAVAVALSAGRLHNSSTTTTTRLTSLDLTNFLLVADDEEEQSVSASEQPTQNRTYQMFVDALDQHPMLTNFNLAFGFESLDNNSNGGHARTSTPSTSTTDGTTSVVRINNDDDASRSLLPLIRALKTIPKLEWVRLDGAEFADSKALPDEALQVLCRTSTKNSDDKLTVVEVHDFDLSGHHLYSLSQVLATNTTVLKVLSLTCRNFVDSNSTRNGKDNAPWNNPLAQMLRTNETLEKFFVNLKLLTGTTTKTTATKALYPSDFETMTETFQALEANQTLKELKIYGPSNPASASTATELSDNLTKKQDCDDAFRSLLYTNYTLERLEVPYYSKHSIHEVQLHMKLNTIAERGRLVRHVGTTRGDWVNAFLHVQDDVSCLFHLLLLNPLLCSAHHDIIINNYQRASKGQVL